MDSSSNIIHTIKAYIQSVHIAGAKDLDECTMLVESGILDSFAIVEMIAYIEEEFGIRIPNEEITKDNFSTIRTIADYIVRKKA